MKRRPKDSTKYELMCQGCNKPFTTSRSKMESGKKFCSFKCRWVNPKPFKPRKNLQRKVALICEWCKNEYIVQEFKALEGRRFCSQHCANSRRKNVVDIECLGCKKVFTVNKSTAEKGKKYCSMQCYRTHVEDHPRVYRKPDRVEPVHEEEVKVWARPLPLFGLPK